MRNASHTAVHDTMRSGSLLPPVVLRAAGTGEPVELRSGRGPRALLLLHSAGCAECRATVERLAAAADALSDWGARLTGIVPGTPAEAASLPRATGHVYECLADPDHQVADGEHAGLVITDEWGEVYFAKDAGPAHELPAADEIVDWVRFISMQCPECGVPTAAWKAVQI